MTRDQHILNELFEISPTLANISHAMLYTVPEGYFHELHPFIMQKINAENEMPASEEIHLLSPLLSTLSKKMPYEVEGNYFNDLSENIIEGVKAIDFVNQEPDNLPPFINNIKDKVVFNVPENYFETLPQQIIDRIQANENTIPAKVIKGNFTGKFLRYAVAAAIVGFVFLGGWLFFSNKNEQPTTKNIASIENEVKQLSDSELNNYVDKNTLGGSFVVYNDNAQMHDEDVQYLLANVSDTELQQYLQEQTGAKASLVN